MSILITAPEIKHFTHEMGGIVEIFIDPRVEDFRTISSIIQESHKLGLAGKIIRTVEQKHPDNYYHTNCKGHVTHSKGSIIISYYNPAATKYQDKQ